MAFTKRYILINNEFSFPSAIENVMFLTINDLKTNISAEINLCGKVDHR